MKATVFGLACLFHTLLAPGQRPSVSEIAYSYKLPVDATNTTLGVKDSTGALIRTMFAGKNQKAGTYSGVWDGKTDMGDPAKGGPFTVVLLYGNPVYTWEGKVGNTSNQWAGINKWESFYESLPYARITFVNNVGWTTQGKSEGTIGLGYFTDTDPNTPNAVSANYKGNSIDFVDIATDGQFLYVISASPWAGSASFATKFDAHNGQPALFTSGLLTKGLEPGHGGPIIYAYPGTSMSGIDVNPNNNDNPPTAIAVQTAGNLLAIGHGNYVRGRWPSFVLHTDNIIKFFDKGTGSPVGHNVTLANPTSMAFSAAGLWVTAKDSLNLILSPGDGNKIIQPIAPLSNPIAVDVNKSNGHIYVLDGGTSQQLKEYDANYKLVRTYGQLGGYTDCNPSVAHDRLMVDNKAITGSTTPNTPVLAAVRVESNGDAWITDTLDNGRSGRLQHLTPNGSTFKYVSQVQFSSVNYWNGASHTQPTRLYIGMLEYTLDYSVPNKPGDPTAPGGNNFWRLTRAWTVGAGGACGSKDLYGLISTYPASIVATEKLGNGHVYAALVSTVNGTASSKKVHLVELPVSGTSPLRLIAAMPFQLPMDRHGNFRYSAYSHGGAEAKGSMSIIPLTGFDANNNPTYGPGKVVASWTFDEKSAPSPESPFNGPAISNNEPTTGGRYAIQRWAPYDSTKTTDYAHIGGILPGRDRYLFTVNREVCSLSFLTNGSYPCTKGTGNYGTGIFTEGRNIISVYGSQASAWEPQYWHYWEDGMFVGQFGPQMMNDGTSVVTNGIGSSRSSGGAANQFDVRLGWRGDKALDLGLGQNMGSAKLVAVNGDLYLHVMSESNQTPNQVWHISHLSSLHEISGTGNLGSSVTVSKLLW